MLTNSIGEVAGLLRAYRVVGEFLVEVVAKSVDSHRAALAMVLITTFTLSVGCTSYLKPGRL